MLTRPGEHPPIAERRQFVGDMRVDPTTARFNHGQVDRVAIWVASYDEVVLFCEHDHCGRLSIQGYVDGIGRV